MTRLAAFLSAFLLLAGTAGAQQRPLVTEDPEPVGAGRVLIEGGLDYNHDQHYPVSGLQGNLVRFPILGVSVGISSIAEIQIDGGPYDHLSITKRDPRAPLANLVTVTGDSTHAVDDIVIGAKIRFTTESGNRPAIGFRFATRLPNASNESGLGLDTTDFYASLLAAHNIESLRIVGNLGLGILADPTSGNRQNDVLTYGVSVARAVTDQAELVGEINGYASTRAAGPLPGTENRSALRLGARYTPGPIRFDAGLTVGLTTVGPTIGMTIGLTYVFNAFTLP
jgi:hypothetical protein